MSAWAVSLVSAVAAGLLAGGVPAVVRRLPRPSDDDRPEGGAATAAEQADVDYAAVAAAGWFLPVGVLVSALAAGVLGRRIDADPVLVMLVPLVPLGYALAVIDARTRRLPRRLVVPATLIVAAALVAEWGLGGDPDTLVRSVVGLVAARTMFWVLWFLGGLGFGDVRLAALTGLVTARIGWPSFAAGIYAALGLAVIYLVGRAAVTRRGLRGQPIAMGPFLVVGAWVALVVA